MSELNDHGKRLSIHKTAVEISMNKLAKRIRIRGSRHDNSAMSGLEHAIGSMYSKHKLPTHWISDPTTLGNYPKDIQSAIKSHYENNDHHPEHFENGMYDMNIIQLTEMICDVFETLRENGVSQSDVHHHIEHMCNNYNIAEPLSSIIKNTIVQLYEE